MIVLNAGAALYAADHASSFKEGVQLAHDALHTGLAREKMDELAALVTANRGSEPQRVALRLIAFGRRRWG